ncbi:MAG: WbqC family protein [Magnetococcales bacterium]|nr:WbqC family protein [Magnetococcales bacterium]
MTTLAVLQPGYLPWLGFFDQLARSDIFIIYDDVQFDKNGWRNRNRVKTDQGAHWLTVPVRQKGLTGTAIRHVEIDNNVPWGKKHLATLAQYYAKAPFAKELLPELETLLTGSWPLLVDLDLAVMQRMCHWLGLRPPSIRSSELHIAGERSERLLQLCLHFGADRYLSGNAAKEYLDLARFERHGIAVEWQEYRHPVYPQLHGPFVPYLSTLDLLLNVGPGSLSILRSG